MLSGTTHNTSRHGTDDMIEAKRWYCVVHNDEKADLKQCWGPYEDYESAEKVATRIVEGFVSQDVAGDNAIERLIMDGTWCDPYIGGVYIMEMFLNLTDLD
jgi:hypothetical protein